MLSERTFPRPARPPALRAGDGVRLKFLYPGGTVEIVDCRWIAIMGLGANGSEALSQWVVIDFEGREIWKPLCYLVQAEVLEENRNPAADTGPVSARPAGDLGYHW